jgi:hypothetical protein
MSQPRATHDAGGAASCGGAPAAARKPHEGGGPCVPYGGRHPGRHDGGDGLSGLRRRCLAPLLAAGLVAAAIVSGTLLAACGGSSGGVQGGAGSSLPASATPSPGSAPFRGTPRQAVAAYWALVGSGDRKGLTAACVPGSTAASASSDIAGARLLRVARVTRRPGGAQVQADVRIVPASATTPWGETGTHTLFIDLTKTAGGGWLVSSWGTSP